MRYPTEAEIEDAKRNLWDEQHPEPEEREDTNEEMWVLGNHRSAARLIAGYRMVLTDFAENCTDEPLRAQAIMALQGRFPL